MFVTMKLLLFIERFYPVITTPTLGMGKWWIVRDFRYIMSTCSAIDSDTRDDKPTKLEFSSNLFMIPLFA